MPIHIFKDREGFSIWSDCERGEHKLGRCIGTGKTLQDATWDAVEELTNDLLQLTKPNPVIEEAK